MKMNEGQRSIAKNYAVYAIGYMIVYPLINLLFGKGVSWETIWIVFVTVLIVGVFNLLLIIGAKNPKDK